MASSVCMPVAAANLRSTQAARVAFKGQPLKAVPIRAARQQISTVCRAAVSTAWKASYLQVINLAACPAFCSASVEAEPQLTCAGLHMQAPLVGSTAPDFSATAVFDQEFIDVKLSQYRVSSRLYMVDTPS